MDEDQVDGTPVTVAQLTRDRLGELSAGERKVGRALLSAYPVAGLETVAELATRAGVSAPTVVRFVARLGFAGYPHLQRALMSEVHAQMGSPVRQIPLQAEMPAGEEFLPFNAETHAGLIRRSFEDLPTSEFEAAISLLCDESLRIHVVGGRFSHLLAAYLVSHLQLLRAGVTAVPPDEFSRTSLVADASRQDLLVVFDYRRYDPATVRLAQAMATAGARTLLLTDPWLSPVADVAEVVLSSRVESPSPFDSLVPGLALVETLVTAAMEARGQAGRSRVELMESVRDGLSPENPAPLEPFQPETEISPTDH
ncbi:MurR/RpiR family transcriptional regulator [Ornithinimicrobium faecis]|uniref:MurR/RpiR family transcriptional regulator n=1 Tax=Ornithinimicrobium faecis TaxID=2934158 RepID=A0ABY4YR56_9MICO|nr:MurR/RpiR family transcriptional regulator [Ornithinimicrobium sp. HY1793]USQ79071.1 MurR/RpiR family transcriptional regulator [Ornithinimicrobium sp. HY1793]